MGSLRRNCAERLPGRLRRVAGVDRIVELNGGSLLLVLFVEDAGRRQVLDGPNDEGLVVPVSAIPDAIGKAMLAIGRKVIAHEDGISVAH